MKKLLLIAAMILTCTFAANAQAGNGYKNAIGARGALGAEVSYQRYVAPANRLEATLGINKYGFCAELTHQWMFEISSGAPGVWQWYAGAGAGLGVWNSKDVEAGFCLGVLGQVGIEYSFAKVPLMLSLDYRPGFYVIPATAFDWTGFALGFRYCF